MEECCCFVLIPYSRAMTVSCRAISTTVYPLQSLTRLQASPSPPPPQWANSGREVSITSLKSITRANTPNHHKTNYHHQPLMHHHQPLNHHHHHKNHNNDNTCPECFILELSWLLEGLESSS